MHLPATALPGAPSMLLDPAAQAVAAQVFGRRSSWWNPGAAYATAQLGYTPANKAGEAFTGPVSATTLTSTGAASIGGNTLTARTPINGNVTVATAIPVGAGNGGTMVLIRGADLSGVSFMRIYLLAVRVAGGAAPDVAATLVSSAGTATPSFTFSNVGGFVNITATGNNFASACAFGG